VAGTIGRWPALDTVPVIRRRRSARWFNRKRFLHLNSCSHRKLLRADGEAMIGALGVAEAYDDDVIETVEASSAVSGAVPRSLPLVQTSSLNCCTRGRVACRIRDRPPARRHTRSCALAARTPLNE
jgi:hypothetical protein